MPSDYKDVEIRIRGPREQAADGATLHDVEVRVEGSGLWKGASKFQFDALDPSNPESYGVALGKQLANPTLLRALDQAGLSRGERLRLRLIVDEESTAPHWVRWERLWFPIGGADWRIAVHPRVYFSRYVPVELPDGTPPDVSSFNLLLAVANPAGLAASETIDVEGELSTFLQEFEQGARTRRLRVTVLPGRTGISDALQQRMAAQNWRVRSGPTTLQDVSDELHREHHGIHILAHGEFDPSDGVGSLLLESADGGKEWVRDTELQSWVTPDLQIAVFQACLSAGTGVKGQQPFTGLAPRVVRLGVPAAVAMQDYVAMEDARLFFAEFYRSLLDEGVVDVAVNRARQRLIKTSGLDNWSIPALFTRLRGGRLWNPDPLREAVLAMQQELPPDEMQVWPLTQVVKHSRGIADFDPLRGASGPRFDLWDEIRRLGATPGAFAVLTGASGSYKAAQLRRLYRELAARFGIGDPDVPMPVFLKLSQLAGREQSPWPILPRIWAGEERPTDRQFVEGRCLLFLIDGEENLAGVPREAALAAINRLRALPGSRTVMVADERLVPAFARDFADATLLVVQPLDWPRVSALLEKMGSETAKRLMAGIRAGGYADLASQPRFLQHLLELSARGTPLHSRRAVVERVAAIYMARMDTRRVPRRGAEEALERIAWQMQNARDADLSADELYPILTAARGGRDFTLSELRDLLTGDCQFLVPSGDEGVRFAYAVMQSYFAARYLAHARDRSRLIENITASLGRLSRLRRWDRVLVLLAGMLPSPGDLLRSVLAGSSLMEGEQLFLAVRCYQEAVAERPHTPDLDDVFQQMVDSLIWRSSWDSSRSYTDRRNALDALIVLTQLGAADGSATYQHALAHLVTLACDPVPSTPGEVASRQYDWAGIRQASALCLATLATDATNYVKEHRPDLVEPLRAWWALDENPEGMRQILFSDDPRVSVIAAFAFAQTDDEQHRETLLDAYERVTDIDVKWAIVNALTTVEATWVQRHVVTRWIDAGRRTVESAEARELRAEHVCFLVQKTCYAAETAHDYLRECVLSGAPAVQGRAIRALGKLQDQDIEQWLRRLCEAIVSRAADRIDPTRMRIAAAALASRSLQRAALEALRDVGDNASMAVIRNARALQERDQELRQLSFQVTEEMYWRLSGGMVRETFGAGSVHER